MSQTMTVVDCTECGHENEIERVYCHECGSRLDRTAFFSQEESDEDKQKRLKKAIDPRRGVSRAMFFKVSKVILAALAVAIIVLLFMAPPVPAKPESMALPSEMRLQAEKAVARHTPQIQFSEDQLNNFLIYSLKSKK